MPDGSDATGAASDPPVVHDEPPSDLHSRLASSAIGRVLIGAVLVVVGSWVVLPNMPGGPMRTELEGWWQPATELGLVQDWAVFSPNPRSQSLDVRAEIFFGDGSAEVWDVPDYDPLVGAFRSYRWRKWQERVRLDDRADLWGPTIDWLRAEHPGATQIILIRRWIDHAPLTANGATDSPADGWNEFRFCTWTATVAAVDVAAADDEGDGDGRPTGSACDS